MILCDDIHVHAQDNDVFVEILMIIHHDHDINYCIRFGGEKLAVLIVNMGSSTFFREWEILCKNF